MPCFCLDNKPLLYLWMDKKTKEPYILFVDRNLLKHPALETGDRVRMKILRVNPKADLETKSIKETIGLAISTRTKKPDHK